MRGQTRSSAEVMPDAIERTRTRLDAFERSFPERSLTAEAAD
jgi:hypothetical protein